MSFKINGIDLNPKKGDSWMGLTRRQAKWIANIFIVIGILFLIPPVIPDPTDLLQVLFANKLSSMANISFSMAYGLIYLLGALLFITGIWIYPYNTHLLFNGYIKKAKTIIKNNSKKTSFWIMIFIVVYILFWMG